MSRKQKLVASASEFDLASENVVGEKHVVVAQALPVWPVAGRNSNRFDFVSEAVNEARGKRDRKRHSACR